MARQVRFANFIHGKRVGHDKTNAARKRRARMRVCVAMSGEGEVLARPVHVTTSACVIMYVYEDYALKRGREGGREGVCGAMGGEGEVRLVR